MASMNISSSRSPSPYSPTGILLSNLIDVKYAMIGDSGVGKSQIAERYVSTSNRPGHGHLVAVKDTSDERIPRTLNLRANIWDTTCVPHLRYSVWSTNSNSIFSHNLMVLSV